MDIVTVVTVFKSSASKLPRYKGPDPRWLTVQNVCVYDVPKVYDVTCGGGAGDGAGGAYAREARAR